MPKVARVEQELLLRLALLRSPEGYSVEAAREPLDDRKQLQRAERLPQERVGAGLDRCVGGPALGAAQDDDRDVLCRAVALQLAAEGEAVNPQQVDVKHVRIRVVLLARVKRVLTVFCSSD